MTPGSDYSSPPAPARAATDTLTDAVVDTLVRWPMRVTEATMDFVLQRSDQDLSGDDLKYVIWSIVFTKPGHETILQPHQEELVNYAGDSSVYAAAKIARVLDHARHGHIPKPASWSNYPPASEKAKASGAEGDKGWRIPPEDQKYIVFLYRVDRRLPRHDE